MVKTIPQNSKEISGYDGFYRVDTDGQVWSCRAHSGGGLCNKKGPWKKLKGSPSKEGHLSVGLSKGGGKVPTFSVHRLVLETFVGPCPKGQGARHFPDRDPSNNKLSNLSWSTQLVNQKDRCFHGTNFRGEDHCRSKLTESIVREIRRDYRPRPKNYPRTLHWKHSATSLAKRYKVDPYTVLNVVRRLTWKHVL